MRGGSATSISCALGNERTLLAKSVKLRAGRGQCITAEGRAKAQKRENDERNLFLLVPFDLSVILLLVFAYW
jgi:hypothetical protein